MTTAGDNITKANITASMAAIRDSYNSGIYWHNGSQPFQTDITGGGSSGYSTQSFADDISDTNVTASTITSNFRSYANLLSRIRSVRLVKYFQTQGNPRSRVDFDETHLTNLNGNYAIDTGGVSGPTGEQTISASDLDSFVSSLSTAINNNRTNTVTIEEFYCHSNCHGSCHGSI